MSDRDAKLRPIIGWGIDNENTKCPTSFATGETDPSGQRKLLYDLTDLYSAESRMKLAINASLKRIERTRIALAGKLRGKEP